MRLNLSRAALLAFAIFLITAEAYGADFQKEYQVSANGRISISNVSGDVTVTGYDGNSIRVTAEMSSSLQAQIEESSTTDSLQIKVKYNSNCSSDCSVNFKVQVPKSIAYNYEGIASVSGDITIKGATGRLKASSASGDILVESFNGDVKASSASGDLRLEDIQGSVKANSASGDVVASIESSNTSIECHSASGDVHVKVNGDLNGDVEMSTLSGSIKTDFPITIETKEYGPGRSGRGRIGSGVNRISLKSVSGDLSLTRGAAH